jgi:hypothetical protein
MIATNVVHDDISATFGQQQRVCPAQTGLPASTGHDRCLAVKA